LNALKPKAREGRQGKGGKTREVRQDKGRAARQRKAGNAKEWWQDKEKTATQVKGGKGRAARQGMHGKAREGRQIYQQGNGGSSQRKGSKASKGRDYYGDLYLRREIARPA
jgi:hypothetical protein